MGTDVMKSRLEMHHRNRLKLGLFGQNCSSGRAATKVPERWSGNWPDNLRLAKMADAAGIDFLLPIARWKGYRGETNFHGAVLETITWACALLAKTERITVFGTVHVPLVHPIFAAKQFTTADIVGEGRLGLNLVVGWNTDEFSMFGVERHERERRYEYGQEWLDVVRSLWEKPGTFDYHGKFFQLDDAFAEPKPYGGTRPIIMNAASSTVGRDFAIRNTDALFVHLKSLEHGAEVVQGVRERAARLDREVNVFTSGYIVCRPTMREAQEYHRYYVDENGDWEAFDHLTQLQFAELITPEMLNSPEFAERRKRYIAGNGSYPIIGDPEYVANELAQLSAIGFNGFAFSFVNYIDEFPYFCDEVLPRLEAMGLRSSAQRPTIV